MGEGVGDHCCEYMTNGVVVVLGSAGRNIGAGMTGGLAYFYDDSEAGDSFNDQVNPGSVTVQRVTSAGGEAQLRKLIEDHAERTGSTKALEMLKDWDTTLSRFWQLVPESEQTNPAVMDSADVL